MTAWYFHYALADLNLLNLLKVKVTQSCLTLCDPMDYTVHGILQARMLEWVAFPFSGGSSQPRDWTQVSCIAGGFFTNWATRGRRLDFFPLFYKKYCYEHLWVYISLCVSYFIYIKWYIMGFPCGSAGEESACNVGDLGRSLGWEDPLEKGKATHSSILAWRIPWTV